MIIKEIAETPALKAVVDQCDARIRKEFEAANAYRSTPEFGNMTRIRNNLAFHYDDKLVRRALAAVANDHPRTHVPISLGNDMLDWSFSPGFLINERVTVRSVFDIAPGSDVQEEADKLMDSLRTVRTAFGEFAGHFVWHCTK